MTFRDLKCLILFWLLWIVSHFFFWLKVMRVFLPEPVFIHKNNHCCNPSPLNLNRHPACIRRYLWIQLFEDVFSGLSKPRGKKLCIMWQCSHRLIHFLSGISLKLWAQQKWQVIFLCSLFINVLLLCCSGQEKFLMLKFVFEIIPDVEVDGCIFTVTVTWETHMGFLTSHFSKYDS